MPSTTSTRSPIVSAVGSLNQPHLPDIPGMDDFRGPSFHSARWDPSVDYRGTRFALVGAGASGFQIAPTIADEVAQLTVFQRTAQWMFPNLHYHEPVPDGERWAMRHLPFYGRWFRFLTFFPGSGLTIERSRVDPDYDPADGIAINETNALTAEFFGGWIRQHCGEDVELLELVMPDYPATGKRTLQDNGSWLQCLRKDNVELVRTGIERVVEDGIVTVDGTHHPADVICYATGFLHNDYLWPMHLVGRGGVSLREQWGIEPTAYLGITVPNFPNLFCLYGPGTNLAHGGSLFFQSECQVNYVMESLRLLLTGGHRTMEPRAGRPRRVPRALRERDLADGVGAPVGEALALQEPRGPHLHAVAVADPDVLAVDARRWTRTTTSSPSRRGGHAPAPRVARRARSWSPALRDRAPRPRGRRATTRRHRWPTPPTGRPSAPRRR